MRLYSSLPHFDLRQRGKGKKTPGWLLIFHFRRTVSRVFDWVIGRDHNNRNTFTGPLITLLGEMFHDMNYIRTMVADKAKQVGFRGFSFGEIKIFS